MANFSQYVYLSSVAYTSRTRRPGRSYLDNQMFPEHPTDGEFLAVRILRFRRVHVGQDVPVHHLGGIKNSCCRKIVGREITSR